MYGLLRTVVRVGVWIVHFVDQHVVVRRGKGPAEEIRNAVSPIGPVIVRGSTLKLVADSRRVTIAQKQSQESVAHRYSGSLTCAWKIVSDRSTVIGFAAYCDESVVDRSTRCRIRDDLSVRYIRWT